MLPYSMLLDKDAFSNDTKTLSTVSLKHRYFKSYSSNSAPKNNEYNYKTLSYLSKKENMTFLSQEKNNIKKKFPSISTKTFPQKFEYTTAYDRIKFFEMYDSDTYPPPSMPMKHRADSIESNYEYNRNEVNLRQVNYDNYNNNTLSRHSKKYEDMDSNIIKIFNDTTLNKKVKNQFATPIMTSTMFSYLSRPASWSDFPFVAVYTYEPAQVYCDCGAISPHWLVSSATCLYLHHRVVRTEGRSAFVSYCGNNWRHPGRVAYVKQSLLHPRFKPLDKTRRQLYNIGLIQVINSMADTCNGWHPISLMSHQFVAGHDGTLATAVGWGLDRYDTRYTSSELPLHSLMLYQGLLYSDSCPGNSGYSEAKLLNEEHVKNVYCLKLPIYVMEENDTVHGSLLLVGGKLIALYLQEERRAWGEQSAQYTGIWRLIPWLLEVAQETDEHGSLDTEI
ncbi:unnamed protein product [Euphydryas editha]|uniref:Peptidase S1 domain-containing protein n=1 Tax=Euphydryas editha TaxID=104508 RepID=A0AAU9V998_EUPED|nr:unnamed protein product [Euphydryas editha]